jgi:hypothetical protein
MRQAYPRVIPPDQAGRGFSLAGSNFGGTLLGVPGERYVNNTAQTRLPHVRLFSQVGPVVLFVAAWLTFTQSKRPTKQRDARLVRER